MAKKSSVPSHVQRFKRTNWATEPNAQDDPLRNPFGIYSGMAKRVAIEDGSFEGVTYPNRKRK